MGYEAHDSFGAGSRIMRLIGLGKQVHEEDTSLSPQELREGLLSEICAFIESHELEVSPENLRRAFAATSGKNPRFSLKVSERIQAGESITQKWLEEIDQPAIEKQDPTDDLNQVAADLEQCVSQFSQTTKDAHSAASDFRMALSQQVETVEQVDQTENVVLSLANIAQAMLARTQQVEEEMQRSQDEAQGLRKSLAQARKDATIDHLTNLPNRRAFEEVFERERREADAEIDALTLAICDIDFFKQVNDRHGHDTGDRVIRAVGHALSRVSDCCHVARHGGEEFVLLFRGVTTTQAYESLDAAREKLSARRFVDKVSGSTIGEITFSGGITDAMSHPDISAALRSADKGLYTAKETGRNKIMVC